MFISPAQRVTKHTLTGRILLFLPVALYFTIVWIASLDGNLGTAWWVAGAIVVGVYIWACVMIGKNRISIHAEGIEQQGAFSARSLRWEDVTETRYKRVPVNNAAHFGLIGIAVVAIMNRRGSGTGGANEQLKVLAADGTKISLSSNYKDVGLAILDVRKAVDPRLLEQARRRVKEGDTVRFGNLAISGVGVAWKNKTPIPFSAITAAEIGGANFRVKQEGKWLDAISVSAVKVPNVFVAIDLIDELKHGGVRPKDPLTMTQQVGF